ncbi:FAD binding domain-containing protein [Bisporella sp. PMI_857]|nr:FAD binding domain-containing protein [Bisporella sp. PMI_857]
MVTSRPTVKHTANAYLQGLKGLVISKDNSTAYTPRAHGFNAFAFECLRDIGLEDEALRLAIRGPPFVSMRFSRSLIGEEYGRVMGWEEHPETVGKLREITPCEYVDLTQRHVEPLLIRYASHHKFDVRFSTELTEIKSTVDPNGVSWYVCTVHDHITNHTFRIGTKYLFGADGGRSGIARSLNFNFSSKPGGPKACNVLLRANLEHLVTKERSAALHWIVKPDRKTFPGVVVHLRVVRPWDEWVMVAFGPGGTNPFEGLTVESPELVDCVREIVEDDSIAIQILELDSWTVRDSVAEQYSANDCKAFLLGDAAHRHPPTFGLGSNTSIQDAYNLAWKVAYVLNGLAGPGLLDSYNKERQPVGANLVRESNNQINVNSDLWATLGMAAPPEEGIKQLAELKHATAEGSARRAKLHTILEYKRQELESLGIAYNQWYTSEAVYLDDEPDPRPALESDPVVTVQISTYPGSRLPHVWIDVPTRRKMISTHDLAGGASFCLLIGVGGECWRVAAKNIAKATGIPINIYGIGPGLEYVDVYRDWHRKRGVGEEGCVLVRPDRFIAWRSFEKGEDCEQKLRHVLDKVLSRHEL